MSNFAIGVDIGGTNLKMGLVNQEGLILDEMSTSLNRNDAGIADISFICQQIASFIDKNKEADGLLKGIGIASPGILDTEKGIVQYAVNLGWYEVPLIDFIQVQLKLPVRLVGDAAAGAIGESKFGAGCRLSSFLYVCLGTGVGAGLILKGKIYEGDWGPIINIGHTSVIPDGLPCKCGNLGCLENYVSASAVKERTGTDAQQVYEAASNGDLYARSLFQEVGELLGISLVNCMQLFGVGNVIIGGGMSRAGNVLLDPVRATVLKRMHPSGSLSVQITPAAFTSTAGILGAAALHF
ncbi:ROK family protein [Paenibacillus roseipurpureus]|uniref:ROK family protein n=1 Tax=Paenibacillus roseopurpureus TaxID=2918901 RepID=A0AA96LKG9_9BACL|nr:ROK family protein [Paenibacillus sp. MBLB1832]WNR42721.1 ROK family protein [Paenibacillus sp. MBLB1832]